jgi:hypothetical protein
VPNEPAAAHASRAFGTQSIAMTADAAIPAEATVARAAHPAASIPAGRPWVLLAAWTILLATLVALPVGRPHTSLYSAPAS